MATETTPIIVGDTKHRPTCSCDHCNRERRFVTPQTAQADGQPAGTVLDQKTGAVVWSLEEIAEWKKENPVGKKKAERKAARKALVRALTPEEQKVADLMAQLKAAQDAVTKQRSDETAYAAAQHKAAEAKRAELQAEADDVNPPIFTALAAVDVQIQKAREALDALIAEQNALKARLVVVPTVQELLDGKPAGQPRAEGAPKVSRIREDGSKAWETPIWLFWKEYQRIYKNPAHSHRLLNEMSKKMAMDVSDRSAANMARMHDYMTGKVSSK